MHAAIMLTPAAQRHAANQQVGIPGPEALRPIVQSRTFCRLAILHACEQMMTSCAYAIARAGTF